MCRYATIHKDNMYTFIDVCVYVYVYVYVWVDGWTDGRTDGRMDGWMGGRFGNLRTFWESPSPQNSDTNISGAVWDNPLYATSHMHTIPLQA